VAEPPGGREPGDAAADDHDVVCHPTMVGPDRPPR
jgi:hypothetical protein